MVTYMYVYDEYIQTTLVQYILLNGSEGLPHNCGWPGARNAALSVQPGRKRQEFRKQ